MRPHARSGRGQTQGVEGGVGAGIQSTRRRGPDQPVRRARQRRRTSSRQSLCRDPSDEISLVCSLWGVELLQQRLQPALAGQNVLLHRAAPPLVPQREGAQENQAEQNGPIFVVGHVVDPAAGDVEGPIRRSPRPPHRPASDGAPSSPGRRAARYDDAVDPEATRQSPARAPPGSGGWHTSRPP